MEQLPIRKNGRDDVDLTTWYSSQSKQIAKSTKRVEIEKSLGITFSDLAQSTRTHLRAIERTHSMTSQSQARAQSRNVVAAQGEHRSALLGALEIYDLFPEHTAEAQQ